MGDGTNWLPVVGFEGRYEVSDDGRVRGRRGELSIQTDAQGRKWVALWRDNHMSTHRVHRLMALAFLGEPEPSQTDACHNDGDRSNNTLANLRWDTHAANMLDIRKHGTANSQNAALTHCLRGHAFDVENTSVNHKGYRTCKKCRRQRDAQYKARLRARASTKEN